MTEDYAASKAAVEPRERKCSSCSTAKSRKFTELRREFESAHPGAPALAPDVVGFVDRYIENKRFGRLFDIASVKLRAGAKGTAPSTPCSSRAPRLLGIPSHVVNGSRHFRSNGASRAFGARLDRVLRRRALAAAPTRATHPRWSRSSATSRSSHHERRGPRLRARSAVRFPPREHRARRGLRRVSPASSATN